jgi:hypothetical protein
MEIALQVPPIIMNHPIIIAAIVSKDILTPLLMKLYGGTTSYWKKDRENTVFQHPGKCLYYRGPILIAPAAVK